MSAANPYERRRDSRARDQLMAMPMHGMGYAPGATGGPRVSPIVLEDLEAMVYNATRRGRREMEERHAEEMQQARREAWAEGHEIGAVDGEARVLARANDRLGTEVALAIKKNRGMLEAAENDVRSVTKGDLAERVERLTTLLERLVQEHQAGFVELPF